MGFIDEQKARFGVVPICRVLSEHACGIAPSSYYAYHARPVSSRSLRDARLLCEIVRVHSDARIGRGLYGARKVSALSRCRCLAQLDDDAVRAGDVEVAPSAPVAARDFDGAV